MQPSRKKSAARVSCFVSSDQKRAWKQMQGDEFKMEFKGFGKKGDKKDG